MSALGIFMSVISITVIDSLIRLVSASSSADWFVYSQDTGVGGSTPVDMLMKFYRYEHVYLLDARISEPTLSMAHCKGNNLLWISSFEWSQTSMLDKPTSALMV
jgi:hypothetical protein